jgi:hypothetical protein
VPPSASCQWRVGEEPGRERPPCFERKTARNPDQGGSLTSRLPVQSSGRLSRPSVVPIEHVWPATRCTSQCLARCCSLRRRRRRKSGVRLWVSGRAANRLTLRTNLALIDAVLAGDDDRQPERAIGARVSTRKCDVSFSLERAFIRVGRDQNLRQQHRGSFPNRHALSEPCR